MYVSKCLIHSVIQAISIAPLQVNYRAARYPVFTRTVRYFRSLSGIRMTIILDNACANSSTFCASNTETASVRYFGKSRHLTTLSTTTQRRSRHSTDTVPEFHAEAPQATVSEGLAQGPYVAARAGVEP